MSMVHKRLFTVVTFLLCFATSLLAEQIEVKKLNRQNPPNNCVNNLCKDERFLSKRGAMRWNCPALRLFLYSL